MFKHNTTAVVESTDSCRFRSTNNKTVGTDIFVPASNAQLTPSYSSKVLAPLDDKTLDAMGLFDYILADTNVVMYPVFASFIKMNADALSARNIKLSFCSSVLVELFRKHLSNTDEEKKSCATRGWNLLGAPEYRAIFDTYPPSTLDTHADYNLLDAARKLKYAHEKNVLILTRDKELTSTIYNACCTGSVAEVGGKVQVLYIDDETANLIHYHPMKLTSLSNDVILPEWHNFEEIPSYVGYFVNALTTRTAIMHSDTIRDIFLNKNKCKFKENFERLKAMLKGAKIHIMSTALKDTEIREIVESNPQIFDVVRACHASLSEEDAIFQAILDGVKDSGNRKILFISNQYTHYENILQKYQTCCKTRNLWGCYITPDGFLRSFASTTTNTTKHAA